MITMLALCVHITLRLSLTQKKKDADERSSVHRHLGVIGTRELQMQGGAVFGFLGTTHNTQVVQILTNN